jgi:tRNA-specific 2-thiouridylase
MKKKKIVVAMSGGVDSSVTAALLKERGHDVMGLAMRVYDPGSCQEGETKTCCSARDIRDARSVAAGLDIPFSSWDVRREFEREVIEPFVEEYRSGRTPNPCVLCNSRIKFHLLLEKARSLGAEAVATGHYARIGQAEGVPTLERGRDRAKDQSYFLFEIAAGSLPEILFPLGEMTKEEVRRRARQLGIEVADKEESQEICFVPGDDYGSFVEGRLPRRTVSPGPIIDSAGRRLGTHRGLVHYTVGQRRGLGIAAGNPLYVTALRSSDNAVVVGPPVDLARRSFTVDGVNWLVERSDRRFRADVKIRSRHEAAPASVLPRGSHSCRVEFDKPQRAVAPGQAAVFFDGERVTGGGWIGDVETG